MLDTESLGDTKHNDFRFYKNHIVKLYYKKHCVQHNG